MKFRYYYTVCKLLFIVLTPVVLLALPADFLDNGRSICLSKILANQECFACGLSRACMHLIHFDFEEAFAYNMACFIVFPLLAIVWAQWFWKEWKIFKRFQQIRKSAVAAAN